jgi:tetratricopeptide (TPR) repeat protein
MSATHPDEATLLRFVIGELPERRQANIRRHVLRCHGCREARDATRLLHQRLSHAGESLAFPAGDPFLARGRRDVPLPHKPTPKEMVEALAKLGSEKEQTRAGIEADAAGTACSLDLRAATVRLAAAHILEEAVSGDPSEALAAFAEELAEHSIEGGGDADAVVPEAQLQALARLVLGNWRLFSGQQMEAAPELAAAWLALGSFDSPEHLAAWAEAGESLRRSYAGRPVEGRVLAERALDTFERYGLGRGIVRSRHARAVALYTASEFREAHREFRAVIASKDATNLDRARAVSGAAFCLAARGRFHEAAKEYSPVRRKLRGDGAMVQQYSLQGEMKAALGTAGRWHPRRDGLAAFALPEASGAFYARATGAKIVKALSEDGLERAQELLAKIESDPSRDDAYLYACQLAMPKVSSDPAMYIRFANAIADATRSLRYLKDKGPAQPACREQVLGEAALLESNALNFLGNPVEARSAAKNARLHFGEACEDSFALALVDFFEGSAASFACDYSGAWKLLRAAYDEFLNYGQENWSGRAEAALGTVLMNRGSTKSALAFIDGALRSLHPERDEAAYASTLINRGYTLVRLSRFDAGKATYAKALSMARRLNMTVSILMIRTGLALIDLACGKLARALMLFERIGQEARSLDLPVDVLCAELRVAECLGRMGREQEMLDRVRQLSESPDVASLRHDQALRELFESVEDRTVNHEFLAHVARFVEGRDRGARAAYKPFRLVAKR